MHAVIFLLMFMIVVRHDAHVTSRELGNECWYMTHRRGEMDGGADRTNASDRSRTDAAMRMPLETVHERGKAYGVKVSAWEGGD